MTRAKCAVSQCSESDDTPEMHGIELFGVGRQVGVFPRSRSRASIDRVMTISGRIAIAPARIKSRSTRAHFAPSDALVANDQSAMGRDRLQRT